MSLMSTLKQHLGSIRSLLVVGSHGFLVSCGADGFLRVWDYAKALVLQVHTHSEFEKRTQHAPHCRGFLALTLPMALLHTRAKQPRPSRGTSN